MKEKGAREKERQKEEKKEGEDARKAKTSATTTQKECLLCREIAKIALLCSY